MVGYQEHEQLLPHMKIVAGIGSGFVARFVTQPLDVIKLKTQLKKTNKALPKSLTSWNTIKNIYREEGLTGFYHGHLIGQTLSIATTTTQFFVYESLTRLGAEVVDKKYRSPVNFVSGTIAGCVSTTLTLPLEVIRVRQMIAKAQYQGVFHCARMLYRKEGIGAFYLGLTPSLLQMGPQVGISFGVFNLMQPFLLEQLRRRNNTIPTLKEEDHPRPTVEHLVLASSISGAVSGMVSKTITYPMDLAKRRLQISMMLLFLFVSEYALDTSKEMRTYYKLILD